MSTQLQRRLFTVKEYHLMVSAGILTEDDRVELLEGDIVAMAPIGSRHAACVKRLNNLFSTLVGPRAIVSIQDPIQLGEHSEPQPDIALLSPRDDFYASSHPTSSDILLLVEVSDTTVTADREVKIPLYAAAGIPEVWLVDLESQRIEVYRGPSPQGYHQVQRHGSGDQVAPQAFPEASLAVDQVL